MLGPGPTVGGRPIRTIYRLTDECPQHRLQLCLSLVSELWGRKFSIFGNLGLQSVHKSLDKLRHVLSKHWCQLMCSELRWAFTHRTTPVLKVSADVALNAPSKWTAASSIR